MKQKLWERRYTLLALLVIGLYFLFLIPVLRDWELAYLYLMFPVSPWIVYKLTAGRRRKKQ